MVLEEVDIFRHFVDLFLYFLKLGLEVFEVLFEVLYFLSALLFLSAAYSLASFFHHADLLYYILNYVQHPIIITSIARHIKQSISS